MYNNNYDSNNDNIEMLNVFPDERESDYQGSNIKKALVFSSFFFVIVGIIVLVVNNKSHAYLENDYQDDIKYCAQLLFNSINSNNQYIYLEECDNIIGNVSESNYWTNLYNYGRDYLIFSDNYFNKFIDNYDYNKSFTYFEEESKKYESIYTNTIQKKIKVIKEDYELYQSVYSELVSLIKSVELNNKTSEEIQTKLESIKKDYNNLIDCYKKDELSSLFNMLNQ